MSIEKLERVLWRVRKNNKGCEHILNSSLRRAIMVECGIHNNTYKSNRKALQHLGWIKGYDKHHIILTGNDLTGDY